MKLESESGAHFLQVCACSIRIKLVAVVPEKYEIALIMPRDDSPLLELRVLRKERSDHAADSGSQHCVEVIKYKLRRHHLPIISSMIRNLLIQEHIGDAEGGRRAIGQVREDQTMWIAPFLLKHHDVSEALIYCQLDNLFDPEIPPRPILKSRKSQLQLLQKLKDLPIGPPVGRAQDSRGSLAIEVGVKFVDLGLSLNIAVIGVVH